MLIIENPLKCLFIALGILAFFLALFKLSDYLENKKAKPKKEKAKSEKNNIADTKAKEESSSTKNEVKPLEDLPGDDKNNYLYDRFVVNPSCEDHIHIKSISDTFITEKDLENIRNAKTHIHIAPVKKLNCTHHLSNETQEKISQIIDENRSARNKLLQEFEGLSKEMKLLLIENIMKKMD